MPDQVFTPEEVHSLNEYQAVGVMHPFTCGGGHRTEHPDGEGILVATTAGWVCPYCDYRQDWAHDWMKDGAWKKSGAYKIWLYLHERMRLHEEYFRDLALGLEAAVERIERLHVAIAKEAPRMPPLPESRVLARAKALLRELTEKGIMPEEKDGGEPGNVE